jgi:flavorubredoxin
MPILEPYIAAGDVYVLPSYLPVPDVPAPGLGTIVINSYLIRAAEPILIDAGMPVVKEDFLKALWELIDPKDLGAVLLTHDDGDHTGALMEVLEAAPQARLYTQFVGLARLETAHHLPIERVGIVNPGQTFTHGGRELAILRPPLFDSPATNAYFDPKSGVLFSADSFGALIPRPAQDVGDVGDAAYADGFNLFNRLNHPWFELVDPAKFEKTLEVIRRLEPSVIASCHSPMARGRTAAHLEAMSKIPSMDPIPLPDQRVLDSILAQIQGGSSRRG